MQSMKVHIVGGGLAGLAAAVRLACEGRRVALYEASPQAGGRCRSYKDKTLEKVIDNGNHLMLSGNHALMTYLERIGAADSLVGPKNAHFPFFDIKTRERWTVKVGNRRWLRWFDDPTRSIPGSRFWTRFRGLRLAYAEKNATVSECLRDTGILWERFWEPMATAVLNTPPDRAAVHLLRATIEETFAKGGAYCRPLMARDSLASSLVDPALAFLAKSQADLFFGQRLKELDLERRAETLRFSGFGVTIGSNDHVILALPPLQTQEFVPDIRAPTGAHAIVNVHYRLERPPPRHGRSMLLGLVGSRAQWLFLRDEIASVTVSAADALAEEPAEAIAWDLWGEIAAALDQPADPIPPFRVIKEKRATFSQTPAAIEKRPPTRTTWPNLHLAGDWTDTGLPATIEGAIRSGERAAEAVLLRRVGRMGR